MRDDFYQQVEERRKAFAERAARDPRDPRERVPRRSGALAALPGRAAGSSSSLSVALVTLLGVVALLGCVASATAVVVGGNWLQSALNSPTSTAQNFYSALQQSDYPTAYTYFSSSARGHLTEAAFADQFGGYDQLDGPVAQISMHSPQYKANGSVALLTVDVTRARAGGRVQVHQVMLVKEQGNWKINAISIQIGAAATPAPTR